MRWYIFDAFSKAFMMVSVQAVLQSDIHGPWHDLRPRFDKTEHRVNLSLQEHVKRALKAKQHARIDHQLNRWPPQRSAGRTASGPWAQSTR
jgi:hypothetical protein